MNAASIETFVQELREAFLGAKVALDGTRTLVRLPTVAFPSGCKPETTEALVVLADGADPELYVKVIPKRPDGGTPRSTGTVPVGSETWCTFSFKVQWDGSRHSAVQFVMGRLARFARNE